MHFVGQDCRIRPEGSQRDVTNMAAGLLDFSRFEIAAGSFGQLLLIFIGILRLIKNINLRVLGDLDAVKCFLMSVRHKKTCVSCPLRVISQDCLNGFF